MLDSAFSSIRQSVRALARSRLTTLSIVATLATCVGALATVFAVVDAVILRALPYRQPNRIVWAASVRTDRDDAPITLPEFLDFRDRARTIDLAGYTSWNPSLASDAGAIRLDGIKMSGNAFEVLGAAPSTGRLLVPSDDRDDAPAVAVLSHAFWEAQFSADPSVIGRTLELSGEPFTVVGILPAHFPLPLRHLDVVVPLVPGRDPRRAVRSSVNFLRLIGRVHDRQDLGAAAKELTAIAMDLKRTFPSEYARKVGMRVTPLGEYLVGTHRETLWIVFAAAMVLLGVALVNVLNLLLIRGASRESEIAVRRALGAAPSQIAKWLMGEGVILGLFAGVIGIAITCAATASLAKSSAFGLPRMDEVRVNGAVLGASVGALAVAVALFGLVPLATALRVSPQAAMRAGSRSNIGGGAGRMRSAFMISQIALAVLLTTTTATILESLVRLQHVRLGFRPDSVFIVGLSLPPRAYRTPADIARFADRLDAEIRADPAVIATGVVSIGPLTGLLSTVPFSVAARPEATPAKRPQANFRVVSEGYFEAIGARLTTGRAFSASDDPAAPTVAIVSKALADRYLTGLQPLGQEILVDDNNAGPRRLTIVGVLEDMRHISLDGQPSADIFIPLRQMHPEFAGFLSNSQFWAIRLSSRPERFGPSFVKHLQQVDRTVAMSGVGTLRSYIDASLATRRLSVQSLLSFAAVALLLASLGVYGVTAYGVEQQRREIGVRIALGAAPADITHSVLQRAVSLAAGGAAIGFICAMLSTRAIVGLLFGATAGDPRTFAAVAVLLIGLSLVASWLPARRAARVDPLTALSS